MNLVLLTYLCIVLYVREIYLFNNLCRLCLLPVSPSRETMKQLIETRQTEDQKRSCTWWRFYRPCRRLLVSLPSRFLYSLTALSYLYLNRAILMPNILYFQNVVGFETSDCCTQLLQILDSRGYRIEQFILSPLQVIVLFSHVHVLLTFK